jgi:hypothetical protein
VQEETSVIIYKLMIMMLEGKSIDLSKIDLRTIVNNPEKLNDLFIDFSQESTISEEELKKNATSIKENSRKLQIGMACDWSQRTAC